MSDLVISDEPITSSGALSVFHAAIDELNRRYGGSDEALHLQLDELMAPRGLFLVARLDDHPIGGVGVRSIGDPVLHLGEIKRLWVRPDQRQHGVGTKLMSEIEERAKKNDFLGLYLETGYAQPEALALYESTGWARVEEFPEGSWSYPGAYRFAKVL
ncbi:MAG TPA: GNAT family N-acetyltransferase [Acidimicrobiales bacterium]